MCFFLCVSKNTHVPDTMHLFQMSWLFLHPHSLIAFSLYEYIRGVLSGPKWDPTYRQWKSWNPEHKTYYTIFLGSLSLSGSSNLGAGLHHGTMKSDHGRWPSSMVRLLKKSIYKVFWPLTRCTPNVDQKEWPCTKKWMCSFFNICPKKEVLKKRMIIKFDHSFVFSCFHPLFTQKQFINSFLL